MEADTRAEECKCQPGIDTLVGAGVGRLRVATPAFWSLRKRQRRKPSQHLALNWLRPKVFPHPKAKKLLKHQTLAGLTSPSPQYPKPSG